MTKTALLDEMQKKSRIREAHRERASGRSSVWMYATGNRETIQRPE